MSSIKAGSLVGFLRGDTQTIGCPVLKVFNSCGDDLQLIWPDGTITALLDNNGYHGGSRWVTVPNGDYQLSWASCSGNVSCLRCESTLVALALEAN